MGSSLDRAHDDPSLSVVVPVFNEERNIAPLVAGVRDALEEYSWELVVVDDGSSDRSRQAIAEEAQQDPRVRLVPLARNYGQSTAMQAGFDQARAPVVVTMDGDLQNDPRDIPMMLGKLQEGYDLVAGIRVRRKDKMLLRRVPSWAANRLIAAVTGVAIRDNGC